MNINQPYHRIAEEAAEKSALDAVSVSFVLAMVPHFFRLPLWVTAFALVALGWRVLQSRTRLFAVPKLLLVPLVMVGGVGVFAQYWTIVGREPGLALLTVMTSFKFLESRTHRDILILTFLCYFLLATHFLFGQSIQIALYMFAVLIVITATLVSINQRDQSSGMLERIKIASRLVVMAIPLMIILFILVPRIPGPIWGLTHEQRGGVTGLSETMSPGQISDLITSNEVAFRVLFDGEIPAQNQLYWRGPVMVRFNRNTWQQIKHREIQRLDMLDAGDPVRYTVTLEPHGKNWLFGLDIPSTRINNSYMSSEYQLTSKKSINDLKRYTLESRLAYKLGTQESFEYLMAATELSEDHNPRTVALGEQWSRELDDPAAIVQRALQMFRNDPFVYTLQPPLLGRHASDEFLFDTRRGFCEHYASSFTLLMRAAGIPARVVTGYQGGEYNQLGDYLIVRQSDAHAWSEVWFEDKGWVRVDPTAAVSPDRIENGLDQALPDDLINFKIGNRNPLIGQILFSWDNMQNSWNSWVLNYDEQKQRRFLTSLGLGIRGWGDMVIAMVVLVFATMGVYWLVGWYRERPDKPAEYERVINRILVKLARKGLERAPSEDLTEFVQRLDQSGRYRDEQLTRIVSAYQKIKYAPGYNNATVMRRFRKMVAEWSPLA